MKIGLYSITYLGLWYRGPALTLEDVIGRAREYGYDGVEIDGKRPHGNPLDLPRARCRDLRQKAGDAGVEIYAVAANNDFSSPIPEHRESQLLYVRDLIRMTADLGVRTLRVFAAWPGVTVSSEGARYTLARQLWREAHLQVTDAQTWDWCCDALREAARWAGDAGVTLALQNHPPVTNNPDDMLRMIHDVASPHVKACLDAPLAAKQGVTSMQQAARAVGALQVLSHFGGEYGPGGGRPGPRLRAESGPHADARDLLRRFRAGDAGDRLRRLRRIRALSPAAADRRRAGRTRLRRHERKAGRRVHAESSESVSFQFPVSGFQ